MDDSLAPRLDAMAKASNLDAALIARFSQWLRTADDAEVFRFNPLAWAAEQGLDEDRALELLLHATKVGILEMSWGVICPYCGVLITTPGGLRALGPNPHCRICRVDFAGALDDSVEVVFSVSPVIRELRFNDPRRINFRRDGTRLFFSPSLQPTEEFRAMASKIQTNAIAEFAIAPGGAGTIAGNLNDDGIYAVMAPTVHAICHVLARRLGKRSALCRRQRWSG